MKVKKIKEIINFISESGLDEVDIETGEIKLHIKRSGVARIVEVTPTVAATRPIAPIVPPATIPQAVPETTILETKEESNYLTIKSPMIGTFYRSPNPEANLFVNVGDNISEGQVLCIIEAMKLFNEIESEVSGKIVKVLVDNASPVEYDQPLFLVDPS